MTTKRKARKYSEGYLSIVKLINNTPILVSALYDLNLLPELVNDKKRHTSEQLMMAVVMGFKLGKGEPK